MSSCLAVVLAGGLGTRIRHLLPELPKPLAPVAGRPFLEWVVRYLHRQGVQRIVLSTGYFSDKVEQFAGELGIPGLDIACIQEAVPMGTAGGFLNALNGSGDDFSDTLVLNGDSLVLAEIAPLLRALDDGETDGALLGVRVADTARFGTIDFDDGGFLRGFAEKRSGAGLVNGGVYLFRRVVVARFPDARPLSFEYDVFPALLAGGARIRVVPCDAPFLDIGTEESLAQAGAFIVGNMKWFE